MNTISRILILFFLIYNVGIAQESDDLQQHIRKLVKELKSDSKEQKITALSSLSYLGDNAAPAFPAMIELLHSKDIELQIATLKSCILLEKSVSSLVYEFVKLLEHDNNKVIELTIKLLVELGTESLPQLRKNLNHNQPKVRGRVLFVLAEMGKKAAVAIPDILPRLDDKVWQVRYYAVIALGKINAQHKKTVPEIIRKFSDENNTVKQGAVEAASHIIPTSNLFTKPLIALYTSAPLEIKVSILETLGKMKIETPKTWQLLTDGLQQEAMRLTCLKAILNIKSENPKVLQVVAPFLQDKSADVRLATILIFHVMKQHALPYLDTLLVALTDGNSEVKIGAIHLMAAMGEKAERAIPGLLSAIEDPNHSIQASAAVALGKMGTLAIPILTDMLISNQRLRSSISYSLGRMGKKSVPFLLPLLQNPDKEVQFYVLESFAEMKEEAKEAVPALLQLLVEEKNNTQVANVLAHIGKESVNPLIQLCAHSDPQITKIAADILIKINMVAIPLLLSALEKENTQIQLHILYVLGKMNENAVIAIPNLVRLYSTTENIDIKANIIIIIGNSKTEDIQSFSILLESLTNNQNILKKQAALAVGKMGEMAKEAIPLLINILKEDDHDLKRIAAQSLTFIGEESVPFLIQELALVDDVTKAFIIISLGNLQEKAVAAVPTLVAILRQTNADIRLKVNIVYALANIKGHSQVTMMALQEQLSSDNLLLKKTTVIAMGKLGDWGSVYIPQMLYEATKEKGDMVTLTIDAIAAMGEQSVPYIVPFLKNKDNLHKEIIIKALAKMGESAQKTIPSLLIELENSNSNIRKEIIIAIKSIGDPTGLSISSLSIFLRHEDWEIRELAAITIGNMGKTAEIATPVLLPLLDDPSWAVRNAVTEALVTIGGNTVVFGLRKALQKPYEEMRIQALIALKNLQTQAKEAVPDIFSILQNKELSTRVRANAIYALGEIDPDNVKMHQVLIEYLNDTSWYLREAASFVLKKIQKQ